MKIINGLVFEKEGTFVKRDLYTSGDIISENSGDDEIIDAKGLYVIPGLTDIHFHGCVGYDFCDGTHEAIQAMAKYQLSRGVTQICPASMTYDEEKLTKIFKAAASYESSEGARLVGINMEGPFISYEKKAAQNPKYIQRPNAEMFYRLQKAAGGLIKMCDIAPEVDGAMECIEAISKDVHVSLAHSAADYETAMKAISLGADHITHLYNGMNGYHHREPGIIGAASDSESVYVELIGDGVHSTPAVVRTTFKFVGDDRLVLICDSMEACGMEDGEYELGGQAVIKKGNKAVIKGMEDVIAGSAVDLMTVVKTVVNEMGIDLARAIKCAAVNSAKSIGIFDKYGSLDINKQANMVLLDENLEVKHVIMNGKICIL